MKIFARTIGLVCLVSAVPLLHGQAVDHTQDEQMIRKSTVAYSNMRNGSYGYNYGYPYQYGPAVPQRPYFPPDPFGNPATSIGADPNSRGAAQERLNQELNKEE